MTNNFDKFLNFSFWNFFRQFFWMLWSGKCGQLKLSELWYHSKGATTYTVLNDVTAAQLHFWCLFLSCQLQKRHQKGVTSLRTFVRSSGFSFDLVGEKGSRFQEVTWGEGTRGVGQNVEISFMDVPIALCLRLPSPTIPSAPSLPLPSPMRRHHADEAAGAGGVFSIWEYSCDVIWILLQ